MKDELNINMWKSWYILDEGFFISKDDNSGTIWINKDELKDLKELIKRTEKELRNNTKGEKNAE